MSLVPGVDTSEFRNDFWKRTRSDYDLETLIGLCKGHFDEVALVINLVEVPSKDVYWNYLFLWENCKFLELIDPVYGLSFGTETALGKVDLGL